jgi:hypothetical protein
MNYFDWRKTINMTVNLLRDFFLVKISKFLGAGQFGAIYSANIVSDSLTSHDNIIMKFQQPQDDGTLLRKESEFISQMNSISPIIFHPLFKLYRFPNLKFIPEMREGVSKRTGLVMRVSSGGVSRTIATSTKMTSGVPVRVTRSRQLSTVSSVAKSRIKTKISRTSTSKKDVLYFKPMAALMTIRADIDWFDLDERLGQHQDIFKQIIISLYIMHKVAMVYHNDVKKDNVLIHMLSEPVCLSYKIKIGTQIKNIYINTKYIAVLGDFGLVSHVPHCLTRKQRKFWNTDTFELDDNWDYFVSDFHRLFGAIYYPEDTYVLLKRKMVKLFGPAWIKMKQTLHELEYPSIEMHILETLEMKACEEFIIETNEKPIDDNERILIDLTKDVALLPTIEFTYADFDDKRAFYNTLEKQIVRNL